MKAIILSQEAEKELTLNIPRRTQELWGKKQLNEYLNKINKTLTFIRLDPEMGRSFDHKRKGMRGILSGKHYIFYQNLDTHIYVGHILDTRMDYDNILDFQNKSESKHKF